MHDLALVLLPPEPGTVGKKKKLCFLVFWFCKQSFRTNSWLWSVIWYRDLVLIPFDWVCITATVATATEPGALPAPQVGDQETTDVKVGANEEETEGAVVGTDEGIDENV